MKRAGKECQRKVHRRQFMKFQFFEKLTISLMLFYMGVASSAPTHFYAEPFIDSSTLTQGWTSLFHWVEATAASVVQLVRTWSFMRVVMSSSPD